MKAYLILSDGSVYEGIKIGGGADKAAGEAVFTTSMTGYMETLCDPVFYGQLVIQTFPVIGAAGEVPLENDGLKPVLAGYIAREVCSFGSNFRKKGELNEYLKRHNIPGIMGIDTRAVTRKLRDSGTMAGMIVPDLSDLEQNIRQLKNFKISGGAAEICVRSVREVNRDGSFTVAVLDMGGAAEIENALIRHGAKVIELPSSATFESMMLYKPDGIIISDGPGSPADYNETVKEVQKMLGSSVPLLGVSLGHQLMASALGAQILKLKHGHRGSSHPVKALKTNKISITKQNHGYYVSGKGLNTNVLDVSFISANDATIEGLDYKNRPAFSVQFKPDSATIERFIKLITGAEKNA